jgi:hypothetical protein
VTVLIVKLDGSIILALSCSFPLLNAGITYLAPLDLWHTNLLKYLSNMTENIQQRALFIIYTNALRRKRK